MLNSIDIGSDKCILPKCKKAAGVYKICFTVVGIIFLYWVFMLVIYNGRDKDLVNNDPMNYVVFTIPGINHCCSMWPISHFILFFILGLLFPEEDLLIISLGVLWELTEDVFFMIAGRGRQPLRNSKGDVQYAESWWAGSFQDIIVNTLGFYCGKAVIKASGKKICVPWLNSESSWCDCKNC